MADALLLSGFINVLFERLAPEDGILKYFQGKEDVLRQIDNLRLRLTFAPMQLKYAEEKQLTENEAKDWLDELTKVTTKAAYLLDKIDYQDLQPKMEDESATSFSKFKNYFATMFVSSFERNLPAEVIGIVEKVDFLLDRKDKLRLTQGFRSRSFQKLPPPFVGEISDVCGRDKDGEDIVNFLLLDDVSADKPSVICIVGMCGVGKTTLAQLVYYNNRVQDHFQLKAWVVVSEESNFLQIIESILGEVTDVQLTNAAPDKLLSALVKILKGKKFLFVFDNFCIESSRVWGEFKDTFKSCAPGSKIIVTTCSKIVGSKMGKVAMHELDLISDEDCWQIFAKRVFNDHVDPDKYSQLKKIGMKIVKKCEGLPLAVKCLAGVMRPISDLTDMRETQGAWRKKLETDIWQLLFEENKHSKILPDLWPSYRLLTPVLKGCLAYCSIFPKDYEFRESDREKIILLWMALGLLKPENGKRMKDVEGENLEALISKSFFQYLSQSGKQDFVMHGLVHDLVMRISREFCFHYGNSIGLSKLGTKFWHLSYRKGSDVIMKLASLPEPKISLCTLLALPLSSNPGGNNPVLDKSLLDVLFQKGEFLKILSLSGSSAVEIPKSIAEVKHLRYIDFSDTQVKRLPDSICDLLKLQTLILSGCKKLVELPSSLAALVNLFHLDIRGTSSLKQMPPQMFKMKSLHRLSDFVLGKHGGSRIKELGELKFLGGILCIRGLENIVDVSDVEAANLKDKEFLTELILIWESD